MSDPEFHTLLMAIRDEQAALRREVELVRWKLDRLPCGRGARDKPAQEQERAGSDARGIALLKAHYGRRGGTSRKGRAAPSDPGRP